MRLSAVNSYRDRGYWYSILIFQVWKGSIKKYLPTLIEREKHMLAQKEPKNNTRDINLDYTQLLSLHKLQVLRQQNAV